MTVKFVHRVGEVIREVEMTGEMLSLGRGSDADERFDDNGLSRLNSIIYSKDDVVWIVDNGSTNGTYINGEPAAVSGTILKDGDRIKIGTATELAVKFASDAEPEALPDAAAAGAEPTNFAAPAAAGGAAPPSQGVGFLPIMLIAGAIFIITISAVVIAFTAFGGKGNEIASNTLSGDGYDDPTPRPDRTPRASNTNGANTPTSNTNSDSGGDANSNSSMPTPLPQVTQPSGKKYTEMTDAEKRAYVEAKAMRVAQIIGNSSPEKIPPEALDKIKGFVDAYTTRIRVGRKTSGCGFGDNLQATFERASKNAPFIVKAFNEKGVDPRIGLYLAMIESEHCTCLQSGTGPLGMFQFTYATAKLHFDPSDGVIKGASPSRPDVRCQPEPAARAAASYMKALTGRYGTGPASVPLAIGSYNSGEGGLSSNLETALRSGTGLPRDFWTLISKGELLSKQFQAENFKYVPKFFAAAIIGENPQDFGMTLNPVSSYTQ